MAQDLRLYGVNKSRRSTAELMLELRTNRLLIASLAGGTVIGLAGVVGGRFALADLLKMPEDAELVSVDGAIVQEDAEEQVTATPRTTARQVRRGKRTWTEPIVRRNIFDSTTVFHHRSLLGLWRQAWPALICCP